jgi:flagellar hook protein FlgE
VEHRTVISALAAGYSGIHSALVRQTGSAHNLANLLTEAYRPYRTLQTEAQGGGSVARLIRPGHGSFAQGNVTAPSFPEVDIAYELVDQIRAGTQLRASVRAVQVQDDLLGTVIDAFG